MDHTKASKCQAKNNIIALGVFGLDRRSPVPSPISRHSLSLSQPYFRYQKEINTYLNYQKQKDQKQKAKTEEHFAWHISVSTLDSGPKSVIIPRLPAMVAANCPPPSPFAATNPPESG